MSKRKKKKVSGSTVFFVVMLLVGLSVMLYPSFSDWWNSKTQTRAVANYDAIVQQMKEEDFTAMFAEAERYNKELAQLPAPFAMFEEVKGYNRILNVSGTGIMGYITIPSIEVELPLYHGTSEEVLNIAAGHLQGSTFPIGGKNTHGVISAHRGLPSARLFTDLDKLVVGDLFTITILNKVFTYEVEEILIVKPEEMDKLAIIPDGDYITLMTCTPYGINTHRLLLRSHRIENVAQLDVRVFADMVKVDPMLVIPIIAAPLLIGLLLLWIFDKGEVEYSPKEIAEKLINDSKKG